MNNIQFFLAGFLLLAASFLFGCNEKQDSTNSPIVVFEPMGYIRVGASASANSGNLDAQVLGAVDQTARAEGWQQLAMESAGLDGHVRTDYVFKDESGNEIRLSWVTREGEKGIDLVLLVSADKKLRAAATTAIWSRLMPRLNL